MGNVFVTCKVCLGTDGFWLIKTYYEVLYSELKSMDPQLKQIWISGEHCTACHYARQSEERVMWVVKYNNVPVYCSYYHVSIEIIKQMMI